MSSWSTTPRRFRPRIDRTILRDVSCGRAPGTGRTLTGFVQLLADSPFRIRRGPRSGAARLLPTQWQASLRYRGGGLLIGSCSSHCGMSFLSWREGSFRFTQRGSAWDGFGLRFPAAERLDEPAGEGNANSGALPSSPPTARSSRAFLVLIPFPQNI
jgi:hypothetical protein